MCVCVCVIEQLNTVPIIHMGATKWRFKLYNKISHDGKFINFGVFNDINFIEITGFQIT